MEALKRLMQTRLCDMRFSIWGIMQLTAWVALFFFVVLRTELIFQVANYPKAGPGNGMPRAYFYIHIVTLGIHGNIGNR